MPASASTRRRSATTQSVMSPDTLTTSGTSSAVETGIFNTLPHKPSSALQKEGWSGVMREVCTRGALVVTHDNQPEAVVMSVEHYQELERLAQREKVNEALKLVELSARFDQQLASLNGPQAHHALNAFMHDCRVPNAKKST